MKVRIDREADALYLRLDDSKIIESEQVAPGVIVDYDSKSRVVGVEVLSVSKRMPKPRHSSIRSNRAALVREKTARKYSNKTLPGVEMLDPVGSYPPSPTMI